MPNPSVTIRNLSIAVRCAPSTQADAAVRRDAAAARFTTLLEEAAESARLEKQYADYDEPNDYNALSVALGGRV